MLDPELRYHLHMARAAKRGTKAALALSRLRGLPTAISRRLFYATVVPVMDYAAPVWYPKATDKMLNKLTQAQSIGARAVTGAFRSVSLTIAEAEAAIDPVKICLKKQLLRF